MGPAPAARTLACLPLLFAEFSCTFFAKSVTVVGQGHP